MNQARSSALQVSVGTTVLNHPGPVDATWRQRGVGYRKRHSGSKLTVSSIVAQRGQNWAVIASSMLWSRTSAFRMSSVLESLTFQAREASVVPTRR